MIKLFLPFIPTDLNAYIDAERSNRYKAAKIKSQNTNDVCFTAQAQKVPHINFKANVTFIWHLPNKKKDPDNIAFSQKFIFDGLVIAGVLDNDGHKQINSLKHEFVFDQIKGVEVIFNEIN